MARSGSVPFDEGVPAVLPQAQVPGGYQRVETRADQFGGGVAQGLQRLGAGAIDAAGFIGQVAAQEAANQWESEANKILYGDPAVPGDRGFYGKEGRDALDAMPATVERLKQLRERHKGALVTPEQQQRFDERTFRLNHLYNADIGRRFNSETKSWATATNKATGELALRAIAADAEDDERAGAATERLREAYVKQAQAEHGEGLTGPILDAAFARADSDAATQRIRAIARRDPVRASQLLEANRDKLLGPAYDQLKRETDSTSIGWAANRGAAAAIDGAYQRAPAAGGDLPDRIIGAESGGRDVKNPLSSASGPGQFIDSTWLSIVKATVPDVASGKSDAQLLALKGDASLSRRMVEAYAAENRAILARQGLPTDDGAIYLAHFLGPQGAADVLRADPKTPMSQIVSGAVLQANPQLRGKTAGDVRAMTASRVGATVPDAGGTQAAPGGGAADASPKERSLAAMYVQSDATIDGLRLAPEAAFEAKQRGRAKVREDYNAIEADWNRQQRLENQRRDQAMKAREDAVWKDVYSDNPMITAREIATDPAFSGHPERRNQMIALINNPPGSALPAAQSWAQALSLLDRVRRQEGDPEKITEVAPLYQAAIDGKLNRSDFEFVRRELENFRTPGGEVFNRRKADFIKSVAPLIDKSNPLMGKIDQSGKMQLYAFEWDLDRRIDEYRKAGKNPADLLDPAKPDFIGGPKALEPYQKTLQQSLQDRVRGVAGAASPRAHPAPAPPAAAPPVATAPIPPAGGAVLPRRPGESPGEYLKRIGAGALPVLPPSVPVR